MRGRVGAWVLGAAVGALASAGSAAATTFPVTRTDDPAVGTCTPVSCSLRQAVAAANANSGPDTVTLPPGTYTIGQPELNSSGPLALIGAGPAATVITGGRQTGPATLARAGVINSGANLAVMRLSMTGNSATTDDPATQSITIGAGA